VVTRDPALAVLEVASIARGLTVVDAMVKRAMVRVLRADPLTPGKYLIVIAGGEADVEEALDAGRTAAGPTEIDVLLLPHVHDAILAALDDQLADPGPTGSSSLGVLELSTVAATLAAADAALKAAHTSLVALHLARGIGGKGYFALAGSQDSVEAAIEAGDSAVVPEARAGREIIPRPHPDTAFALQRLRAIQPK
jgi:microcompartment protein CcmL/EutN